MAITLNGIAQGYITDRIIDCLQEAGFQHVLVQMGEFFARGRRADGRLWRVGIGHPSEDGFLERTTLDNQAIATSSPVGTPLSCDDGSIAHHLFDPRSGKPGAHWQSVSVIAGRAVVADGLSTAIAVFTPDRA